MMDCVRSAGVFSFVEAHDGQENAEYRLGGRLERLDEVDYENGVQVEVKLSAQLVNQKDRRGRMDRRYDNNGKC